MGAVSQAPPPESAGEKDGILAGRRCLAPSLLYLTVRLREVYRVKMMKAIIQPAKVDDVREALSEAGVSGVTFAEVKGFGRQKGHAEVYRGAEYAVDFIPKVEFEVVVNDDAVTSDATPLMIYSEAKKEPASAS